MRKVKEDRTDQDELLREIDAFLERCRAAGEPMAETTFGRLAVNNTRVVEKLRSSTITMRTARRIREFIAGDEKPPEPSFPDLGGTTPSPKTARA